jgi:hypothetical protein
MHPPAETAHFGSRPASPARAPGGGAPAGEFGSAAAGLRRRLSGRRGASAETALIGDTCRRLSPIRLRRSTRSSFSGIVAHKDERAASRVKSCPNVSPTRRRRGVRPSSGRRSARRATRGTNHGPAAQLRPLPRPPRPRARPLTPKRSQPDPHLSWTNPSWGHCECRRQGGALGGLGPHLPNQPRRHPTRAGTRAPPTRVGVSAETAAAPPLQDAPPAAPTSANPAASIAPKIAGSASAVGRALSRYA